jgi:tetratricopeptide (TPR) repeat protein
MPMSQAQSSRVEQALQDYTKALQQLEAIAPKYTDAQILEVLSARNALRAALADLTDTSVPAHALRQVLDLDDRLRNHAEAIAQQFDLEDWRDSFEPVETAWWWRFPRPPHPRERWDWLWSALTLACLTASVSILAALAQPLLSGQPDVFSVFMFLTPSLMTLVASGGALTRLGRETLEGILIRLGLSKHWWHEVKFGLALALLIFLMVLYSLMPQISRIYDEIGLKLWETGDFAAAEARYARSLQLDPSNARTRFHRGQLYADLGQVNEAMAELQLATQAGFLDAYPVLARLYITTDQPEQAVQRLLPMEPLIEDETAEAELRYAIATYLGWARFEQDRLDDAEAYLRQAISIAQSEGVEAPGTSVCLLAATLSAQGKPGTLPLWQACATLGDPMASPEEDTWVREAQQQVQTPRSAQPQ